MIHGQDANATAPEFYIRRRGRAQDGAASIPQFVLLLVIVLDPTCRFEETFDYDYEHEQEHEHETKRRIVGRCPSRGDIPTLTLAFFG